MSTGAIVAIVIGALILIALVAFFVSRSTKPRREQKRLAQRHRQAEMQHEAERERAEAQAREAQARAAHHEAQREAHEHERHAAELDREAGRRSDGETSDRPATRS